MAMEFFPGPNFVLGTFTVVTFNATTINATTFNGVTLNNNAWSTYVPVIGVGSGALTSATASGRWKQIGKTIFCQIAVAIATNGSGTSFVQASLPIPNISLCVFAGRENAVTGKMLQGLTAGSILEILNYDNTYPGLDGASLDLSGVYETT